MSNKPRLRGTIVGCGATTTIAHLPAWKTLRDAEIVAICDLREDVAREVARRWRISRVYLNFSQMLAEEKPDFVDICTPPLTHYPLAIQAIESGANVLVEKPMAISLGEADEMVSSAKKKGVKLCVIHNLLFSPVIQRAKQLVESGVIGDLLGVEIHSLDRQRLIAQENHWCHSLPGGIFNEYTPHVIYLMLSFLGDTSSVTAIARKHSHFPWVKADEMRIILQSKRGFGSITLSCNSCRDTMSLSLFGTREILYVDHFAQTIIQRRPLSLRPHALIMDRAALILPVLAAGTSGIANQFRRLKRNRIGHQAVIQKFAQSLLDDADPPVTGEQARETVKLLEEIWRQLREGSMA